MSDTPPGQSDPQRNPSGPEGGSGGGADGKPKRRRRRRKKSGAGAPGAAQAGQQGAAPSTAPPTEPGASAPAGAPATPKTRPPVRRNRPKPPPVSANASEANPSARPPRGKGPGRPNDSRDDRPRKTTGPKGAPAPTADAGTADAPAPRKKKKKRKVRTKDCVQCFTPHVTIHRVNITYRKQWSFICDMCWADRCVDNPHYEYGGLWMSGRVMPPESELYAEWLAKRKDRSRASAAEPASDSGAQSSPKTQAALSEDANVATLADEPRADTPPRIDAQVQDPAPDPVQTPDPAPASHDD